MSYQLTGQWNVVRQMQYIEETTFGTTPASPTLIHAGPIMEMSDNTNITNLTYRQIGSRDIYSLIKTGEYYTFDIKFRPVSTALMAYGLNLPAGTGTIEKSLTFVTSQKMNNVENYKIYRGCRCDKIDVEITEEAVDVSMSFLCKDISTPATTHGLGTPVFATNPTAIPWTGITSGSNPLTFNSATYDTPRFKFSVANNLQLVKPNGETQVKFIEPTNREVTFDFETWYKDTPLLADTKSTTARVMTYVLNSTGPVTATFTDAYLESFNSSDSPTSNEVKTIAFSGKAKAVAVA